MVNESERSEPTPRPRCESMLSVRLPKELHDALARQALQREDGKLSELVREKLARE